MSRDPLATYVHDHLAGATAGLDLVEALRDRHAGEPLSEFAALLHAEIASDRATLEKLAERLGAASSGLKEAAAWLAEKASRLKLAHQVAGELGTFEALARRAEAQHADVEAQRLALARAALVAVPV